jgi:hypothetical protein
MIPHQSIRKLLAAEKSKNNRIKTVDVSEEKREKS